MSRLEGSEYLGHSGRGNSMCKGSGAGSCLMVGGIARWLSGWSRVSEGGKEGGGEGREVQGRVVSRRT